MHRHPTASSPFAVTSTTSRTSTTGLAPARTTTIRSTSKTRIPRAASSAPRATTTSASTPSTTGKSTAAPVPAPVIATAETAGVETAPRLAHTGNATASVTTGALSAGAQPQQSLRALSTLVSGTATRRETPLFSASSWNTGFKIAGSTNIAITKPLENPFLDQRPPRKLFKHVHSAIPFSTAKRQDASGIAESEVAGEQSSQYHTRVASSLAGARRKPEGLSLTRVLPSNITPHVSDVALMAPSRPATTHTIAKKDDQGSRLPNTQDDVQSQHPSTTPKQPPTIDYFPFLKPAHSREDHSTDEDAGIDREHSGQRLGKTLGTSSMEFARKSITHHAATSPQTTIRKINMVAPESKGTPSLFDLLSASNAEDSEDARQRLASRPFEDLDTRGFVHSDSSFTFESKLLLPPPTCTASPPVSESFRRSTGVFPPASSNHRTGSSLMVSVSEQEGSKTEGETLAAVVTHRQQDVCAADPAAFDLRAALWEGASRNQRELASASSVLIPRASMAQRAAPYKIPTVNEQATLRSGRMPGFRARPLDPKVFISAGDLGVPRIRKQPLTVPVSPIFSKPRVKAAATSDSNSLRTATVTNRQNPLSLRPERRPGAHGRVIGTRSAQRAPIPDHDAGISSNNAGAKNANLSVTGANQIPSVLVENKAPIGDRPANWQPTSADVITTDIYPSEPASQVVQRDAVKSDDNFPGEAATRNFIRGLPSRGGCHVPATNPGQSSNDQAGDHGTLPRSWGSSVFRRPLTRPIPFKFATDEILRRRHVMFHPRRVPDPAKSTEVPKEIKATERSQSKNSGFVRLPKLPVKRLTVPIPFHLATEHRAAIHSHHHGDQDVGTPPHSTSTNARPKSRLAGLTRLGFSVTAKKPFFMPTVPISPKLSRKVPVRSLQPTRFLLKKSTKELTQPHEFHFHSDQRAKEREAFEQSVKRREQELTDIRQRTVRLSKEREKRLKVRESLERTFRARPITHYQPITIHKATRPLTKPVSPMIGEKRKRREMELQHLQQDQWRDHPEEHRPSEAERSGRTRHSEIEHLEASVGQDVYRQFEEAKILQEQHRALQKQLTRQERRQIELANSAGATIHQPPIRLSFPLDPEFESLQTNDSRAEWNAEEIHQEGQPEENITTQALVRDSFGRSDNHHLTRELRRISLEASRSTGGGVYRKRLSDIASRGSSSRGSRDGRSDSETRTGGVAGYYPFTRSLVPTGPNKEQSSSTSRALISAVVEEEDRRRSGSFIPVVVAGTLTRSSPPRISRLTSRLAVDSALDHPLRPMMIDHTLTLSDL